MKIKVSSTFHSLFEKTERYLILYGGRGSGKSEFAGRKVFKRCIEEGNHRFLVLRKVRKTLKESVIKVMLSILEDNEIRIKYNKTDRIIVFYNLEGKRNELLFDGLDDPEKLKSIKGITSIWIEEPTEFTKDDFLKVDLVMREKTEYYKQIIMTFNPDEAQAPWLKDMFFDNKMEDSFIHSSTIEDNPIKEVREEYLKVLDRIADPVFRAIYRKGIWALAKGIIFNWDVKDLPTNDEGWYDDIFYGGDFGFSVNPAALVKIYRKADEFWIEQKIYELGLTNTTMAEKMKADPTIDVRAFSYWDCAEPKSIQELCDNDVNAGPCKKGADSVKAGIDFMLNLLIHVVTGSQDIINERKSYKWMSNKDGKALPIPVKFMCDLMDGTRYGIYTHCKEDLTPAWTLTAKTKNVDIKPVEDNDVREAAIKRIEADGFLYLGGFSRFMAHDEGAMRVKLVAMGFEEHTPNRFVYGEALRRKTAEPVKPKEERDDESWVV